MSEIDSININDVIKNKCDYVRTSITIDRIVMERARELNINVSAVCRVALIDMINRLENDKKISVN